MIWDVPPSCPGAQPVLPISHQPRQNQAEGGTAKIKVNPTQVRQEMCHPVCILSSHLFVGEISPRVDDGDVVVLVVVMGPSARSSGAAEADGGCSCGGPPWPPRGGT